MPNSTPKSLVDRIEALDASIAAIVSATEQPLPHAREELMVAYAKRGSTSVDIGIAEAGLADLLRAYAQRDALDRAVDARDFEQLHEAFIASPPPARGVPFWLWARLGEGFRRYALDVLLTRSDKEQAVYDAIHRSIDCFKKAGASLRGETSDGVKPTPAMQAWILAHRAAARTTLYWMSVSASRPSEAVFEAAEKEFTAAIREQQNDSAEMEYAWAKRFRAFLYAIRGAPGDFKIAHAELKSIKTASAATQSSLNRSLAMLSSYDAVPPPREDGAKPARAVSAGETKEREQAALQALDSAMLAVTQDPEDFIASYFGAVATWVLGDISGDGRTRERYKKKADAAIDGARARSMSAISQAFATLVGLALMTEMMHGKAIPSDADGLLDRLSDFPPDWETRALFMRDPVWQTVKSDERYSHIHARLKGRSNFDALRDKFKVWPAKIDPEDAK